MKRIIIQGSSRSQGNTYKIIQSLRQTLQADFIDLKAHKIGQYDYEYANREDDFLPLMRQLIEYDMIIFATPVYWYSMSGIMKKFFDRITDCLKIEKETGDKLKGIYLAALSCGPDDDVPASFSVPFKATAEYLEMEYAGYIHTWLAEGEEISAEVEQRISEFVKLLTKVKV